MNERSKLIWRCRRGMREMDLLFEKFLDHFYDQLTQEDKSIFNEFLDETDADIYSWVLDRSSPHNPAYQRFIDQLKTCL